ncbi:1,6-anhydro-N-acetylmuramyl-L-alanine amidase AmpD [uncultured Xylophilus sp.]|uniref:1,6-anhydro-N-acetylmuramyl-L-alanine amidase AmpD n=1 Tax=uncultured Xylophilus sp. TaxID=296832 RepID=UPI0025D52B71|nr:1,6-anhydro-N-acetylmuramyl-L-alanine amidase AmpD [uncultured Xylophilus sp.]
MFEPSGDWDGGWWQPAERRPSPNHGPRPADACIDLIVVHSISLPPGVYGGGEVEALFANTLDWDAHPYFATIRGIEVSAHFFVRRDGQVLQFVDGDRRAWHAGRSSYRGRDNCNDDSIGIELEGLEGDTFDPRQYPVLARLCAAIGHRYPIRHVAGHSDIAPGRKGDPGDGFDWGALRRSLDWTLSAFPRHKM